MCVLCVLWCVSEQGGRGERERIDPRSTTKTKILKSSLLFYIRITTYPPNKNSINTKPFDEKDDHEQEHY